MAKKKKIDKASQPASFATEEFASESIPQQGSQKVGKRAVKKKRNSLARAFKARKEDIGQINPRSSFCSLFLHKLSYYNVKKLVVEGKIFL